MTNILPTLIQNSKQRDRPIGALEYIGWGIWVFGFIFEAVADHQNFAFLSNPNNAVSSLPFMVISSCGRYVLR